MPGISINQYTFDVIDRLGKAADIEAAFKELKSVMASFGFQAVFVSRVPPPDERMEPLVMANGWPEGWTERYMSRNYDADDPTLPRPRQNPTPFLWSETRTPTISRPQARILDEATEFGMNDGLVIPIHGRQGHVGGVSFGGDKVELDSRDITALHMIGLYGYEAMLRHQSCDKSSDWNVLSPRELECVKWTAEGKTAWETGLILGISEATVNQHIKNASRKMDAANKPHLVARCIRAGIL